jgi:hypothetical protein
MYISKDKRITYEHRDEDPISEYQYKGKTYFRTEDVMVEG